MATVWLALPMMAPETEILVTVCQKSAMTSLNVDQFPQFSYRDAQW